MPTEISFRYVLGEKEELVLIVLYGRLSGRDIGTLEEIENILNQKSQPILLLNFHDVTSFMPAAHQCFAKFQKRMRDKGKLIGICGLRPDVKQSILQSGIVRENEIYNNIPDAWKALHYKAQSRAANAQTTAANSKQAA